MAQRRVQWRWKESYYPATLYVDDLQLIERLFEKVDAPRIWALSARDDSSAATLESETLADLLDARNSIGDANEMTILLGERLSAKYPRVTIVTAGSRGWLDRGLVQWDVTVEAFGEEQRSEFERLRRGLTEVFSRAVVKTWPQEHPRLTRGVNALLLTLAVAVLVTLIGRLAEWPGLHGSGVDAFLLLAGAVLWVMFVAERRLSRMEAWRPAPYDLLNERAVGSATGMPPSFVARDVVVGLGIGVTLLLVDRLSRP